MSASYAGDRLQQLAQAWLVATLTHSALAVGAITMLGSLPLLLSPIGGVIADQIDRRRLLFVGQGTGAISTAIVATLVLTDRIAIWHIYMWALINGMIVLVSRPSYKVALTESVPPQEVRSAVAINSMTETLAMVLVNAGGSVVLELVGLPVAFVINAATYLAAAASVWSLRSLSDRQPDARKTLQVRELASDLRDGAIYLVRQPVLLYPLLLTFATIVAISPSMGLLPAIIHQQEGSIVDLGLLAAAFSIGAFLGAAFAGARDAGQAPVRHYALFGVVSASALALFAALPVGIASLLPLSILGFVAFSEAVWNTSRVRRLAHPAYQARVQSFTSMAFTLGAAFGALWGGAAIDRYDVAALYGGASALASISLVAWWIAPRMLAKQNQRAPFDNERPSPYNTPSTQDQIRGDGPGDV
jgi:predicted MFS family arabinose efflux permease